MEKFSNAIAMLNYIPEGHRLYARILYTKDECAALNRNIFQQASILATAIASTKQASYKYYYYISDTNQSRIIQEIVKEYFERRQVLPMRLLRLEYNMPDLEMHKYFELILRSRERSNREREKLW